MNSPSSPAASHPHTATKERTANWLVVIDHHEARIYRSAMPGALPQQIRSQLPEGFLRPALPGTKESARNRTRPDAHTFFEPVAGVLNGAGTILILGSGADTRREMDLFAGWLRQHRPALAGRIIATLSEDEPRLTEEELLARARDYYAHAGISLAPES